MSKKKIRYAIACIVIVAAAYLISKYCFQLMLIQGESMQPTYNNYQLVFINKDTSSISKGDVVVFDSKELKATLVKRVVATAGDKLVISDGILYVNEKASDYVISTEAIEYAGIAENEVIIPENGLFVIGDNINNSVDSRYDTVGIIRTDSIKGLVIK